MHSLLSEDADELGLGGTALSVDQNSAALVSQGGHPGLERQHRERFACLHLRVLEEYSVSSLFVSESLSS